MSEIFTTYYDTPVGKLKIAATNSCVTEVLFSSADEGICKGSGEYQEFPAAIQQCIQELSAYFSGGTHTFEVPFQQEGTVFQKRVWDELIRIPFGKTISYIELAKRLGDVKAIRAAASANGKNRISIIVPCHRVIGSNHELVGYGGGLSNKRWLLEHEAKVANGVQTLF